MREVLFRGKTEDGKWVDGFYVRQVDCCGGVHFIFHCAKNPDDSNARYNVMKETVGQFTGLLDANGEKIFEGDIVEVAGEDDYFEIKWDADRAFFTLESHDLSVTFDNYSGREVEVIGNIHDNPELMEVAND